MIEQVPSAAAALAFVGVFATAVFIWLEDAKAKAKR